MGFCVFRKFSGGLMTIKILNIECPEGHGDTTLTIFLKEHINSSGKVDRVVPMIDNCEIQDKLLLLNKNCNSSCYNSYQIKSLSR